MDDVTRRKFQTGVANLLIFEAGIKIRNLEKGSWFLGTVVTQSLLSCTPLIICTHLYQINNMKDTGGWHVITHRHWAKYIHFLVYALCKYWWMRNQGTQKLNNLQVCTALSQDLNSVWHQRLCSEFLHHCGCLHWQPVLNSYSSLISPEPSS